MDQVGGVWLIHGRIFHLEFYFIFFDFDWLKVCMQRVIGLDRNGGGLNERNLGGRGTE